nr:reverse transcriptase domain-containing protein [Tanacetum cinerariifolium]
DQDSLNSTAGGNLLERRTQDGLTVIKNKSKQTSAITTAMTAILKQFQATPPPASVKAVEEICVTCGGAHPYYQCLAAGGNTFLELRDNIQGYVAIAAVNYNKGNSIYRPPGSRSLPRNTIANRKGKLKYITTRSGIVLDRPSVPILPPFINPKEDERVEETLTDQDLAEYTIKVAPHLVQKSKPLSQRDFVVHQRDPLHPNILYPSRMLKQKQQEKDEVKIYKFWKMFKHLYINITLADALILIPKYHKMLKALLTNKEKLQELTNKPLNENCSAVILKKLPEKLRDPGKFLIPYGFNELKCKALADLEIEYLLHHDPIKDIDSILKDSIDQSNLADLNDNLVDSMPEMFTDEHALDYSFPPLYDEYDDDLFKVESEIKNVYDDPFNSKGEKIKESKLLIDELDLPCDFLPSSEYDSFPSEDFSKVDVLPLTNNEDKVFNPGMLIQENLFEIITRVAQDKKLAISHASLMIEDFDPPLYELPFFKEVPRSKMLLLFSSENEEKLFKPGIHTSEKVHSSLITSLSYLGYKVFKINLILKSPMKIFLFFCEKDTHIFDVPCPHFYPI